MEWRLREETRKNRPCSGALSLCSFADTDAIVLEQQREISIFGAVPVSGEDGVGEIVVDCWEERRWDRERFSLQVFLG